MKENQRKFVKCGCSPASDPDTKLFRFPMPGLKNSFRCESWAKYCFPEKEWFSREFQEKLYSEHRMLCNKHFKETSFSDWPDSMKKLHKYAVPEALTYGEEQTVPLNKDQPGPSCSGTRILEDTTNFAFTASKVTAAVGIEDVPILPSTSTAGCTYESSALSRKRPRSHQLPDELSLENKQQKVTAAVGIEDVPILPSTSTEGCTPKSSAVSRKRPRSHQLPDELSLENKRQKDKNSTERTDKERKYYRKARVYLKRICQLRNNIKKLKDKNQLEVITTDQAIKKLGIKISPALALLLQGEIKIFSKKPKGRRWSTEEVAEVAATVCDMGGMNRRALTMLGATVERPVIKVDDKEIVTLFDAPHLLKCFRNNFMKHDIKCKASVSSSGIFGEGVAKWSDIKKFFEIDSTNANFVFAPSLKKEHLEPNTKQKMKVNLAAQVLSHTVAAGILAKVAEGEMPATAAITADVISNMDKLFDLVNSDTSDCRRGKPYATNMSTKSPHVVHFRKMKSFFNDLQFVGCPRPPPSLEGWVWTINGIIVLWNNLNKFDDVHSLSTRRLQQDPLENLFGCIRGNWGSNVNPTTSGFIGGMKTAVMSNLTHIAAGNCEKDDNVTIINNFKNLLSPCQPTSTSSDSLLLPLYESAIDFNCIEAATSEDSGEMQACAYVCGFLIKNHKLINHCAECKKKL